MEDAVFDGVAVSVVIPTCANARPLERTIGSILATGYEPLEILVVENRPPAPDTRRLIEEAFARDPVHYLEEPRRGASLARNAGLAQAQGEIVAFTDDDVVVDPGWIDNAVAAFASADDVTCVTGRILPLSLTSPTQLLFEQFAAFDKGGERRVFRLPESRKTDPLFPYVAGHIGSGANIFIRRDAALAMGGFDPVLGPGTPTVGGEDLDLFIRLAYGGRTIVYEPAVTLRHDHPDHPAGLHRHAYQYGIGLTAMLGKQLLHGPDRVKLLRVIPAGMRYGFSPRSRKNVMKASDYPRRLDLLERSGMMLGPIAYLLSLAQSHGRKLRGLGRPDRIRRDLARRREP